jgi:hypothetical protein
LRLHFSWGQWPSFSEFEKFRRCSIDNFLNTGLEFLKDVEGIPVTEFVERRDMLANALVKENVDAFVAEPGYAFLYYANVSQPQWEVWEVGYYQTLLLAEPFYEFSAMISP